jgi:TPR repeat protein/DNA-binding transcriptional ArsR family regulator
MLTKFSRKEHHRLREVFIESAELRIIGASSVSLEFHYDYGKPFYQFFKMPQLKGLTTKETNSLLIKLGEHYKRERVRNIVEKQPGRVEALRRLTGGVIRTIVILFDIFVDDTRGNAFKDLEKILDSVTPLYKHRMDKLSAQQQEIVDYIALNWDAVSTREIAQKTKLQSKAVSSQLKKLEKFHIIEKEKTDTKNFLYRISERFFNICYLMRMGRKWDEKRVRFLVEFLQIWCDEKELERRAKKHLEAVRQSKLPEKHVLYLTEALVRTPIQRELQHQLISETRSYLHKSDSDLEEYLSKSDYELKNIAIDAFKQQDIPTAANYIEKIKIKDADDLAVLGELYAIDQKNIKQAEEYLLKAIKKDHSGAMYNLADLYRTEFKDFEKAEKYYLMAVKKDHAGAMNNLANLYLTEFKDFEKAEKYYLMAVEKEDSDAMFNLALMYENEFKDFHKAEKYYLMAVEKDNSGAMFNLALMYQTELKDFQKAEKYYLMAVEKDHSSAMNNLALLYETELKDFQKAEKYYLLAVEKDHSGAMYNLALMYQTELKDFQKAEKYYLMAVKKANSGAMNNLAWMYENEFKDFQKAEKYYLMAVEKDNSGAMNNLALLYETELKDFQKAEKYYLLAVEKDNSGAMYNLALMYQTELKDFQKAEKYYLMAVEKDNSGAMNSLAWMYFKRRIHKQEAIKFAEKSYKKETNIYNMHTYATILLWNNEIEEAFKISQDFLKEQETIEKFPEDVSLFLLLLMAKKQYFLTRKIFNDNPFHLKDRFKPVYYALMFFMKNEYPNEYRKMGGELKQTVEEIIEKIHQLEKDYQ